MHRLVLFILPVLLYANTLHHDFVLDDEVVIVRNIYVQQGLRGIPSILGNDTFAGYEKIGEGESLLTGGRYRPLSLVVFALIFHFAGPDALMFHLILILLYAGAMVLLYNGLTLMLKDIPSGIWIAVSSTLLFTVHPVHTEVVANIKSTDEVLALLFGLTALYSAFMAFDKGRNIWWWISGGSMFLGCMAKENAVTLALLIPLALRFFRKGKNANMMIQAIPVIAGAIGFLILRQLVLGEHTSGRVMHDPMNNPFLVWNGQAWEAFPPDGKIASILYTFGQYIRLLVWPYPLTHDYYPFHISLQSLTAPFVLGSGLVAMAMGWYILFSIRRRDAAGYGFLFFLISISVTANLFFPVGTFMAERFVFLPSFGFILSCTMVVFRWLGQRHCNAVFIFFIGVSLLFSIMTVRRNPAWKDNITLLRTDLQHSPMSAKLRNDLGTCLLEEALKTQDSTARENLLQEAFPHLNRALELHPTYYDAYLAYGACAYYIHQYERSVYAYRIATQLYPGDPKSRTGLWYALQAHAESQWKEGGYKMAISFLEEAWHIQADSAVASKLAQYYQSVGQHERADEWTERAIRPSSE